MIGRWGFAASAVVLLFLSGCTGSDGSGESKDSNQPPGPAPEPKPTAGFGSIAGNVTDDEEVPVSNVDVGLVGTNVLAKSDAAGRFTFNGIEPGTYQVLAQKFGYEQASKTIIVTAGNITDVKLEMKYIPIPKDPVPVTEIKDGYIACAWASVTAYSFNRCGDLLGGNRDHWTVTPDTSLPLFRILVELVWEPATTATGQNLEVDICPPQDPTLGGIQVCEDWCSFNTGPSPKLALSSVPVYGEDDDSGPVTGYGFYCQPLPVYEVWIATGTAQPTDPTIDQDVTVYITLCYAADCGKDYSAIP